MEKCLNWKHYKMSTKGVASDIEGKATTAVPSGKWTRDGKSLSPHIHLSKSINQSKKSLGKWLRVLCPVLPGFKSHFWLSVSVPDNANPNREQWWLKCLGTSQLTLEIWEPSFGVPPSLWAFVVQIRAWGFVLSVSLFTALASNMNKSFYCLTLKQLICQKPP